MSFGEMTIILDHVSYLLHLSIKSELRVPQLGITKEVGFALIIDMLGVSFEEATLEVSAYRSIYNK